MTATELLLFVYGTLRPARLPPGCEELLAGTRWVGTARLRGALYDLGPYPALLPAATDHDWVHGDLLQMVDPAALPRLDRYEGFDPRDHAGSLYVRKRQQALDADDRPRPVWVYFYNQPLPHTAQPIAAGDYAAWRQHLDSP